MLATSFAEVAEWLVAKIGAILQRTGFPDHISNCCWSKASGISSMEQVEGGSAFAMRDRKEVASSLSFGTFNVPTWRTLER